MERNLLGVDVGTGSVKVSVITETGKQVGLAAIPYELTVSREGWREADADRIWSAFVGCLRKLIIDGTDLTRVAGIGISCLCPGLAAFDKNGKVLQNPIIYSDQRSEAEAEWINATVGEERLFEITANRCMSGAMSGASMLWMKRYRPELYAATRYFGHINTLLGLRMTGNYGIDYSNASYTSLFETTGGLCWSRTLCELITIDIEKLPPLLASDEVLGGLISRDIIDLGIPEGTPVVIGGGDTACAALAAGTVEGGDVCESVGTTNVLTVCVDKPQFDRSFINRCHVVGGKWIYQGAMSHIGASMIWFRDTFCRDIAEEAERTGVSSYDLLDEMSRQSKPGADGIVFLPYMMGERSPVWDSNARGVFFGMSLDSTRNDFVRSIHEAAGYGDRQLKELAEKVTGKKITSFASMGGGAKSEIYAQIKADIIGADIELLEMTDMASAGAALLAGIGTGIFENAAQASETLERRVLKRVNSRSTNREAYERGYAVYTELYPRLKELFGKLQQPE